MPCASGTVKDPHTEDRVGVFRVRGFTVIGTAVDMQVSMDMPVVVDMSVLVHHESRGAPQRPQSGQDQNDANDKLRPSTDRIQVQRFGGCKPEHPHDDHPDAMAQAPQCPEPNAPAGLLH